MSFPCIIFQNSFLVFINGTSLASYKVSTLDLSYVYCVFFLATSTGEKSSMNSTSGGRCKTQNMKLKFHICANSEGQLFVNAWGGN